MFFINKQIKILEKKRKELKDELQELAWLHEKNCQSQKESFVTALKSMKSSVKFAVKTSRKGHQAEVVATKKQIIKALTDRKSEKT